MSPKLQIELASILTAIFVSQWYRLKSINYFKAEHLQTQFWSNFETTECCDYPEYKVKISEINLTLSCLQIM